MKTNIKSNEPTVLENAHRETTDEPSQQCQKRNKQYLSRTQTGAASNDDEYDHQHLAVAAHEQWNEKVSYLNQKPSETLKTKQNETEPNSQIPERVFMNGLLKHTGIALAIIVPLAAISAYAASAVIPTESDEKAMTKTAEVTPTTIVHHSANEPTPVDSIDLKQYVGTWYEIGRLPMYFQRNCVSDVTATYTETAESSNISVLNRCKGEDGEFIEAEGVAKPVDAAGSKLKVTFLPSWIRWLPVGRADYWVLAHDPSYQTALVGTPDLDYLWLLARSPNISQQTYAKYRQIAQQQGYNLKEFKLTEHDGQTVKLVP
ncbi:lipocalin family protein [Psychrobacter sp. F1192]|uniref:Lipocalin family protein n=1 Tax=Psychrobacter coccoides TaxID=2818440 RepID=A0ABS3NKL0_9GAMM|nr:lipocalin family protein [Psychrobacter coccoides]MBO1529941.1 lipocalin family protein [Psychrobacter coccoides]